MRNVLIVNHYAVPPTQSGGTRHFALARWLVDSGWRATIIADSTHHKTGECRVPHGRKLLRETVDGVDFLWVAGSRRHGIGTSLARLWGMLRFAWAVATLERSSLLSHGNVQVVIGSSVHPFAAAAGWFLAWRLSARFIFEVRDLWPETLVVMGKVGRRSPVAAFLYRLESFLFRKADRIISPLPGILEYVVMRREDGSKVRVIPNGIDLAYLDECLVRPSPLPASRHKFTFLYAGAMGNGNDLETLLQAFKILQSSTNFDAGLRLVGAGPAQPHLERFVQQGKIQDVEFFSVVPKCDIYSVMRDADVLVITVPDHPDLYRYGVCANKMFDYLGSGRVTISANSAKGDVVAESGGGFNIPAGNPLLLSEAMGRALELEPVDRERYGQRGRDYISAKHDFKQIARELASVLDEIVDRADPPKPVV